ncbi:MAG: hypothetical protein OXS30_10990 [Chloroflexota bacterium]|nr:hypothetical protein [Chloroflexota bacterium]
MKRSLTTILLLGAALLGAALLGLACGSTERLTVAEYAEFCADGIASASELIEPETFTWADLLGLAAPSLARLRSVEPPEVLGQFHRLSIKTLDFVVGVAEEQPPDERANPLAFGLDAVRIATQLARAVEGLPADVRARLGEAGCL